MDKHSHIFVAGHNGLVGSAIVRHLLAEGFSNVIVRSRQETDLENQSAVLKLFLEEKPEYVFMADGKLGGYNVTAEGPQGKTQSRCSRPPRLPCTKTRRRVVRAIPPR